MFAFVCSSIEIRVITVYTNSHKHYRQQLYFTKSCLYRQSCPTSFYSQRPCTWISGTNPSPGTLPAHRRHISSGETSVSSNRQLSNAGAPVAVLSPSRTTCPDTHTTRTESTAPCPRPSMDTRASMSTHCLTQPLLFGRSGSDLAVRAMVTTQRLTTPTGEHLSPYVERRDCPR